MIGELLTDTEGIAGSEGVGVDLATRWNVGRHPNGGYLLAVVARQLLATATRPDPLTMTAHYLSPVAAGPATVGVEIVRAGRTQATVAGTLHQGGKEMLRVLGAVGDLATRTGPTLGGDDAPALPDPAQCVSLADRLAHGPAGPRSVTNALRRYDLRVDPASSFGRDVDAPCALTAWVRFADGTEPTTLGLLALADAFVPTTLLSANVGWVPTVELTVHVLARPAPGWLRAHVATRAVRDGLLDEDGELWDAGGALVARFRQLAVALAPSG